MITLNRRGFVHAVLATGAFRAAAQSDPLAAMALGVITSISADPEPVIRHVHDLGFRSCQLTIRSFDDATVAKLREALTKYGVEASSAVSVGPPPEVYDFYQGPETIGLVPRQHREARIAHMKQVSDFAKKAGIPAVQGHCGFIPENPNDPLYGETVEAIRTVAAYCRQSGQTFRCETGQETPITLVRAIKDVGLDNVGVNFDAANLILYGKANPTDAVDVFGSLILGVHAKDGLYPTDPRRLGREVAIGQGKVNFPVLIERLKGIRYKNPITIEREISGEKQTADILAAKAYLERLIG